MDDNLIKSLEISRVAAGAAAGTGTTTSSEVNMAGADSVLFLIMMGAITGGSAITVKAQQDAATGMGIAADLEGTSITITDAQDDLIIPLEIVKPREQFVRVVLTIATQSAVLDGIVAIKRAVAKKPVTQPATVATGEIHISPAEGTA